MYVYMCVDEILRQSPPPPPAKHVQYNIDKIQKWVHMHIGEEGRAPLRKVVIDWWINSLTRAWKARVTNQFLEKLKKRINILK